MEEKQKVILVPWDFSASAELAFQHAIQLAQAASNDILLFHIVAPNIFESKVVRQKKVDVARHRLKEEAERLFEKYGVRPDTLGAAGNLKKAIIEILGGGLINLIVAYKTYTIKPKKAIGSSKFLRGIKNAIIPFLVVEGPPSHSHYIEIVVPLDYDRKYKETVHWIIHLSKYYKCNINLIKPFLTEETKKRNMASNIFFTKKMLDGNKIVYGIKTAKKNKSFTGEIYRFAQNIDADLILIMSDKYDKYVRDTEDVEVDVRVPIMCINPRIRKYQSFS
ncbi:MAG TPA: universal stress protein [Williamwhitmania sp.]|nr:universal stress protein [Williamwhitmania sp.]